MNSLTLEQASLLNEYILAYKMLNITNDFKLYDALQNRLIAISRRFGFEDNTSQLTIFNFCNDTLETNNIT